MLYYGYHRTSTKEQNLDRKIAEIKQFCESRHIEMDKVYTDQQTGKNFDRPGYKKLKDDALRKGDCLVITEIDRLGRSKEDTMNELRRIGTAKGKGMTSESITFFSVWDPMVRASVMRLSLNGDFPECNCELLKVKLQG